MIATCPFLVPPSTLSSSRSLSVSLASLSSLLLSTVRLILVAPSSPPLPSSFFLPPGGEGARAILYVRELASLYKYVRDSTRRISNELAIKHHEQKNTRRGGGFKVFFSLSLSLSFSVDAIGSIKRDHSKLPRLLLSFLFPILKPSIKEKKRVISVFPDARGRRQLATRFCFVNFA